MDSSRAAARLLQRRIRMGRRLAAPPKEESWTSRHVHVGTWRANLLAVQFRGHDWRERTIRRVLQRRIRHDEASKKRLAILDVAR